MQGDARDAGTLRRSARLQIGEVVGVDALTHLYGQRDVASSAHCPLDDLAEQPELPGQRRPAALAGNLRHRASEVQIDVICAVLSDQHGDRIGDCFRVNTVELNTARHL